MGKKPSNNRSKTGGRFQKGNRANPHGRPVGSRNRSTILSEMLADDDIQDVFANLVRAAKGRDKITARWLADWHLRLRAAAEDRKEAAEREAARRKEDAEREARLREGMEELKRLIPGYPTER